MIFEKHHFYVLSGGPGVGKTTLMAALAEQGMKCVAEPARAIIQTQMRIGGDALHDANRAKFRDLMLSHGIADYMTMIDHQEPVFFDRGIAELYHYAPPVPDYVHNAIALYRYHARVFILPPWEEIYCQDAERHHSFAEAIEVYHTISQSYLDAGYEIIEVPPAPIPERARFVMAYVTGNHS